MQTIFQVFFSEEENNKLVEREVFEIDLEGEIKVTFDPKLPLYLVESRQHLGNRPIRVPAEVVKVIGHEESSDVSKVIAFRSKRRLITLHIVWKIVRVTCLRSDHAWNIPRI